MAKISILLSLLSVFNVVRGHGYVQQITAGSAVYTGYLPYTDPYYNIQCNGWSDGGVIGSTPAPIYGTVAAGTKMGLNWTAWPDSHAGPMITYMALAPSNITAWLPGTSPVWFKVAESGKTAAGFIYSFTIPAKLKPGQYIIRHEIIALHAAYIYPGAQFYPSCIQVQVTGSGTSFPPASSMPLSGAYTATTPGIVYNMYTIQAYPIPGPTV
ncbi:glycoside hydrolase family 61 protein [Mycena sp. CBHHK59/15]|nr:glycoside hydrolase family 61 protein [Mycena sp. CBHHK59/15]